MAKDMLGNKVNIGDKIHFSGMIYTVKEINENRVIGGKMTSATRGVGLKIPDSMILELDISGDFSQPINAVVVKTPPEVGGAEA